MVSFIGKQKRFSIKCTECKVDYNGETEASNSSCETECPHCGNWNYKKFSSTTKTGQKTKLNTRSEK